MHSVVVWGGGGGKESFFSWLEFFTAVFKKDSIFSV